MKCYLFPLAVALISMSSACAADDATATKQDSGMMKHCRSMMKDGKMMDNMPKQMTEKCRAMMNEHGMESMQKGDGSSGTTKPAP